MRRFTQAAKELPRKAENYAVAEGIRLSKRSHGKLRVVGIVIGIIVVILIAEWMVYHP